MRDRTGKNHGTLHGFDKPVKAWWGARPRWRWYHPPVNPNHPLARGLEFAGSLVYELENQTREETNTMQEKVNYAFMLRDGDVIKEAKSPTMTASLDRLCAEYPAGGQTDTRPCCAANETTAALEEFRQWFDDSQILHLGLLPNEDSSGRRWDVVDLNKYEEDNVYAECVVGYGRTVAAAVRNAKYSLRRRLSSEPCGCDQNEATKEAFDRLRQLMEADSELSLAISFREDPLGFCWEVLQLQRDARRDIAVIGRGATPLRAVKRAEKWLGAELAADSE